MAFASLTIDLNARIANIERDMGSVAHMMETRAASISAAFGRIGGVLAGLGGSVGFLSFVKQSIDAADNLNDLSKKTGIAVSDLAGLQLVVDKSGTSMEMLGNGIGKLNKYMGEAALGNKDAQATLAELGITAKDPLEAFIQLADAFGRFDDEGQRAAIMSKVIGKTWGELAPALAEGGAGLRAMMDDGKRLNPITQELAEQSDKFNDSLSRLKIGISGAGTAIANNLLPSLNDLLTRFNESGMQGLREGLGRLGTLGQTIAVSWAEVDYVFRQTGDSLGNVMAKFEAFYSGNFKQAFAIEKAGTEAAKQRRADLDANLARIMNPPALMESVGKNKYSGGLDFIKQQEKAISELGKTYLNFSGLSEDEANKIQKAMTNAFDTRPLDDYVDNLKRQAVTIRQEYAAMRAESALGATPENPTGLDITGGIAQTREALAGGDTTKAQALAARVRDMLRSRASDGAPGFETDYLSRQVEALELQMNEMAQKTAAKTRDIFKFNLDEWRGVIAAMPPVEIPLALETMKEQIRGAVKSIFDELASKPFDLPIQIPVGEAGLNRAALKLGGR